MRVDMSVDMSVDMRVDLCVDMLISGKSLPCVMVLLGRFRALIAVGAEGHGWNSASQMDVVEKSSTGLLTRGDQMDALRDHADTARLEARLSTSRGQFLGRRQWSG